MEEVSASMMFNIFLSCDMYEEVMRVTLRECTCEEGIESEGVCKDRDREGEETGER